MNPPRLHLVWAALLAAFVACGAGAQELPPWDQAKKTYESAQSQYKANAFQQAQGLFEEFIKKYPTHENVPVAYTQLAHCRAQQKNFAGWEDALDNVIKKFPGSGTWIYAHMAKFNRFKALKRYDDCLAVLDSLVHGAKELPLDLNQVRVDPGQTWMGTYWRTGRINNTMPWNLDPVYDINWLNDLVAACDTPERALKALKSMNSLFRRKGNEINRELNAEWECCHWRLLLAAGKDDEAAKVLDAYRQDWGSDPRGIGLAVMVGECAQRNHDDKAADAAYDYLIKTYGSCGSVAYYLDQRMVYLRDHDRLDDLNHLAEYYLKEFPQGPHRRTLLACQFQVVRIRASRDPNLVPEALALAEQLYGKNNPQAIVTQIDLLLGNQQFAQAAQAERRLLADECWSDESYNALRNYANRDPNRDNGLAAVLEEANKKFNIPALDANGPAGQMLAQLKDRIKEEQVRHMEEIGKDMLEKYPQDAATIQAVNLLADYYFDKLLAGPRDQWMGVMMTNYPRHPLTQAVMLRQITAFKAAKEYQPYLQAVGEYEKRFASAIPGNWYWDRIEAYDGMKDTEGKLAFVRKVHGRGADAGDVGSINELSIHEAASLGGDSNRLGAYWMDRAKKCEGTRGQLYCWYRAYEACFYAPAIQKFQNREVMPKEAMDALGPLQDQKLDPEIRWYLEFADIAVLASKPDAKAVADALGKRLTAKTYRDLSLRLNMDMVASAFTDAKVAPAGLTLADKIAKLCYTDRDDAQCNSMMVVMLQAIKNTAKAVECYRKTIDDAAWPAQAYNSLVQCMKIADAAQLPTLANAYIARIANAQDVVPRVLLEQANAYMAKGKDKASPEVSAIRQHLAQNYPASESRGALEAQMAPDKPKK